MRYTNLNLSEDDVDTLTLALVEWQGVLRGEYQAKHLDSEQFAREMQNAARMIRIVRDAAKRLAEPITLKVDNGVIGSKVTF